MEELKPEAAPNTAKAEPAKSDGFAQTSTAAKLSGQVHETAGFFKRKIGEFTGDEDLRIAGRNQQLLGKVHRVVGGIREVRELATQKALSARRDGAVLLRKHGGKLLDQATEFLEDIKKTFL